jgi:hypothetical protein
VLLFRKVIITSGTPEQLPEGKLINKEVRLCTDGNSGNIYLSDHPKTASSGDIRFCIEQDRNIPLKLAVGFELSTLYVDADNDDDKLYLMAQVEEPAKDATAGEVT